MPQINYAQYRDYRGHVIEATTGWLGRPRFQVWKHEQRLGKFGSAIEAERFIDRLLGEESRNPAEG